MASSAPAAIGATILLDPAAYAPFEVRADSDELTPVDIVGMWHAVRDYVWDSMLSTLPEELARQLSQPDFDELKDVAIILVDIEIGSFTWKGLYTKVLTGLAASILVQGAAMSEPGQWAIHEVRDAINAAAKVAPAVGGTRYSDTHLQVDWNGHLGKNYSGYEIIEAEMSAGHLKVKVQKHRESGPPARGRFTS